jgi:hypothetical protein
MVDIIVCRHASEHFASAETNPFRLLLKLIHQTLITSTLSQQCLSVSGGGVRTLEELASDRYHLRERLDTAYERLIRIAESSLGRAQATGGGEVRSVIEDTIESGRRYLEKAEAI